ncbi:calfacilitin-like [Scleropages formosus]|uniref:Calfacilitin-like n=1 Tax=Scleropages formosus TaxID=113540 RepID=A0A0P7U249_SCLFO|nr:calfacilitin-like [Scleropages formosus]
MEGSLSVLQRHPGLSVAAFSLVFRAVHKLLRALPLPKGVCRDEFRVWKWRNLSVSLVHSMLTGPWAVTCVLLSPEMLDNMYSSYTPLSYLLICTSTERVCFTDVIWCFLYTLFTRHYVAGAVVALFVEVNSVFLHTRLLLKLAGAQSSRLYGLNRLINLFTYVLFRLSAQAYLTWYILRNYSWLDHAGYFLSSMMLMNIMILVYFYRLLRADFLPRGKGHLAHNGMQHGSSKKFLSD